MSLSKKSLRPLSPDHFAFVARWRVAVGVVGRDSERLHLMAVLVEGVLGVESRVLEDTTYPFRYFLDFDLASQGKVEVVAGSVGAVAAGRAHWVELVAWGLDLDLERRDAWDDSCP